MTTPSLFIDADACPVKDEIYRVALRHGVAVRLVSNAYMRAPNHPLITRELVSDRFDAADDAIEAAVKERGDNAIVVTADILLADRCLKTGASVIAPNGNTFTPDSIGAAIATRAIMADLRGSGDQLDGALRGPKPFSKADRSRFLSVLDETIVRLKRRA